MSDPTFAPTGPLADLFDLTGRVAVVTGAGAGIGAASAARLAQAGASVVCADLRADAAEATATAIAAAGGQARGLETDVRSAEAADALAAAAVDAWGRIDVVVNAAGIFPPSPALETTSEFWDNVHAINVRGTFLVSQAAARRMVAGGHGGAIVNIASKSAFQPSRGLVHYASSKGAVVGVTKSLALEWATYGIRVNAVAPGAVKTEGARQAADRMLGDRPVTADEIRSAHAARCPLGRQAEPDEMAVIVLFLASSASSFMTGSIVVADGGYMLS